MKKTLGTSSLLTRLAKSLDRKAQINTYKSEVDNYNLSALTASSLLGFAISLAAFILSLPVFGVLRLTLSYSLLTIFFGVIFLASKTVIKKHISLSLPLYYILMISVMLISIYMGTAMGTDTNATTLLLFMLLLPVFIIDCPWRLILTNVIISVLFCCFDAQYKTNPLLSLDIANTIVVCILSAVFVVAMERRTLNNFMYIREEKKKTSEKDMLINAIPVGVAIYEIRGNKAKQVFTNDEFYRLFEDTPEERAKRNNGDFMANIHPDDRESLGKAIKSVIDGKNYIVEVCRSMKGDGTYMWVRFASSVAKRDKDFIEVYSTYSSMEEEVRSKQASEAKTAFLSRMSHDIRTPMNAIIGMTALCRKETDKAVIDEYLSHIDHSSQFLLGLINDILDLSKIESGEFKLNPELYDVREFDDDIRSIIMPLMQQKHINFVYNMECGVKCIMTDKLRFNQIFFNLLSNASKFTPEGGTVEFLAHPMQRKNGLCGIRFTVCDNGAGMSEDFQKKMFTPFLQDSYRMQETSAGTGLGLPIVKSIIDAMSGTIDVKSKLGQGTRITVDLYFEVGDKNNCIQSQNKTHNAISGMKILLAEDNELNILVAKKLLDSKGCKVTTVKNGSECLNTFSDNPPSSFDAILMDVRMPIMDGIEATKKIRALDRQDAKEIPIIAMTADAFTEERKMTLEAGMNAHLTKPVEPEKLFDTLSLFTQNK